MKIEPAVLLFNIKHRCYELPKPEESPTFTSQPDFLFKPKKIMVWGHDDNTRLTSLKIGSVEHIVVLEDIGGPPASLYCGPEWKWFTDGLRNSWGEPPTYCHWPLTRYCEITGWTLNIILQTVRIGEPVTLRFDGYVSCAALYGEQASV